MALSVEQTHGMNARLNGSKSSAMICNHHHWLREHT